MKSGMVAAEALADALAKDTSREATAYPERMRESWLWEELNRARNVRPALRWARTPAAASRRCRAGSN